MININITQRVVLSTWIVLAIITALLFVYASSQWHADWVLAHETAKAAPIPSQDQTSSLIASIPKKHLFGQAFSGLGDAPISSLQFKVTGIVKVANGKEGDLSKAYISIDSGPAKIFEVGDSLPYGVKVYDIAPDAVILENNGHLEKLPLPRQALEFKPFEAVESR